MTPMEQVNMMQRCIEELRSLRAYTARLEPKAEAWDTLVKVIGMMPGKSQGYSEDIVFKLQKEIETIVKLREEQQEVAKDDDPGNLGATPQD